MPQAGRHLVLGEAAEHVLLAAAEHRHRHLLGIGRAEDEDHVLGRLLQGFEEGIEGVRREHVRLVDDVDLAAAEGGRQVHLLAQVPDLVDASVGGGVDLDQVERRARGHLDAGVAQAAGLR